MHELLTPAEMAEADRLTIAAGTPGIELMERAGRAVADVVGRRPLSTPVLVLCGPGNNGGDGFVAARILTERGFRVRLALAGPRDALRGDAALAAARWRGPVEDAFAAPLDPSGVIVDALLGAGLARDVAGAMAALIDRVNRGGRPVVAVDLPSGIDGASGLVRGIAVRAGETVTFFRRKPGHVLLPGRLHCGAVRLAQIGIAGAVLERIAPRLFLNVPALWRPAFPVLAVDGNKYRRGHALAVSGGIEATGAARMAARAALRIGAGLVTVAAPSSALMVLAGALEAVMVRRADGAAGLGRLLEDARRNAVVMGPGLDPDEETRAMVEAVFAAPRPLVLDAGAITAFAADPERLFRGVAASATPTVLTPHDGEFARLFAGAVEPGAGKSERALRAARLAGAVVVLKGPDTVVAAPDGRAAIADNAPPTLGTAGSGDVLAGMIGGLMAQGMPAFEAASAAVWMHGAAAQRFGCGLIAEDLPDLLPGVLQALETDEDGAGGD